MTSAPAERHSQAWLRPWLLGAALLLLLRIVGDYVPLADDVGWLWITRLGEAWTVAGVLAIGLAAVPVKELAGEIGRGRTLGVMTVGALLFLAQFVNLGVGTLPFHKWDMYTAGASELVYVELHMMSAGADVGRVPLKGSISVSREPRTLLARIGELVAEGDLATVDQIIQALITMSGVSGVDEVDIRRCTVTNPTRDQPVACERLRTVPVQVTQ